MSPKDELDFFYPSSPRSQKLFVNYWQTNCPMSVRWQQTDRQTERLTFKAPFALCIHYMGFLH